LEETRMKLPPDFKDLLVEFAAGGVEYVLVGGYAFAYHAQPRATKDLDVLLRATTSNLERAASALTRYGAAESTVSAVRTLRATEVAYMGRPPLRVDFLCAIDGLTTEAIFERANSAQWDGVPVKVIGLDDLITNKRSAARPQDLADVDVLERIRTSRNA
jgi:predicted nucleotidyltransferase